MFHATFIECFQSSTIDNVIVGACADAYSFAMSFPKYRLEKNSCTLCVSGIYCYFSTLLFILPMILKELILDILWALPAVTEVVE